MMSQKAEPGRRQMVVKGYLSIHRQSQENLRMGKDRMIEM